MQPLRIGVIGAGIIGQTHIDTIARSDGFVLAGLVEPGPQGPDLAAGLDVTLYPDIGAMIAAGNIDAAVVATPNETHLALAGALLEAGLPVLVEKPIANTVAEARALLAIESRTGVPILVGHHRRHNPIVRAAKRAIADGIIGELVIASVTCSLAKPESYFAVPWRRQPGSGGPLLINLIHEIDLLRHLFGNVAAVDAASSNARRGLAVEDTAAAILQFERGGMAALAISDTAVGPWAWDLSAGENPGRFPAHPVQSHLLTGTAGGLSLPDLAYWSHAGERDWTQELRRRVLEAGAGDSYIEQLRHFGEVIAGRAMPLVSGTEGMLDVATIAAIRSAAASGNRTVVAIEAEEPLGDALASGGSQ